MSKSRRRGLFGRRRRDVEDIPSPQDDFSADWLPDEDDEALESLRHSDAMRPLNITPEEERFPPIAPDAAVRARSAPSTVKAERKRVYEPIKWGTNLFTVLMLVATCALFGVIAMIMQDPYTPLNPLPPATPFIFITATSDAAESAATATTPAAVETTSDAAFVLADEVVYQANSNEQGCDWTSIAGTVQASDGRGLNGYRVTVDDGTQEQVVFTGSAERLGPGGWELVLGNTLISGQYHVQLASTMGEAVSDAILIELPGDCAANVAVISWLQTSAPSS